MHFYCQKSNTWVIKSLLKVKAITEAYKHIRAQSRIGRLLWYIREQLGYNPCTLVQAFGEKYQLVMGVRIEIHILRNQETTDF